MITQSKKTTNRDSESLSVETHIEESRVASLQDSLASSMQINNLYFLIGWENLNRRKNVNCRSFISDKKFPWIKALTWLDDISWPFQERMWDEIRYGLEKKATHLINPSGIGKYDFTYFCLVEYLSGIGELEKLQSYVYPHPTTVNLNCADKRGWGIKKNNVLSVFVRIWTRTLSWVFSLFLLIWNK